MLFSQVFSFSTAAKDMFLKSKPVGYFMLNIKDGLVIQESESQRITWIQSKLIVTDLTNLTETAFIVDGISTERAYQKLVDKAVNKYTLQTLFNQGCILETQQYLVLSQFFILIIRNAPSSLYLQDEQSIFIRAIVKTLAQITPQSATWKMQKLLEEKYTEEQVFDKYFESSALTLLARIHFTCQQYNIEMPKIVQGFIQVIVEKEHKLFAEIQSEMAVLLSKTDSETTG